ncbi:PREDICTED: glutaminyl-peptide cyclotransferase-like isoform X1 [Branchiostoma belcheri]|uniref:glutaminyl-peptide cyclotransferase n=1 Tax=Branchiostoma belcheri TaxID=7741 RepID=A0A6P4ZNQ4_BRABE|nr:PREDICTED: glutaminyl-peptide cyclotransferase-like isoform X1 [Branchiostoma belcheri]
MLNSDSYGGLRVLSSSGPTAKMVRTAILLFVGVCVLLFVRGGSGDWTEEKRSHQPKKLTTRSSDLEKLVKNVANIDSMWKDVLRPMLRERVPGTPGNQFVRQHIISQLRSLQAGWEVEEDQFTDTTPEGDVEFVNIIATLNPQAKRHLTLACHYDSKMLKGFIGATDSAVPCALMLNIARNLDSQLGTMKNKQQYLQEWWQRFQVWARWERLTAEIWEGARQYAHQEPDLTLQLIFFDGEEAFHQWTSTDSIYGARHLARQLAETPHKLDSSHKMLDSMDVMVLLDLLGAKNPTFPNFQFRGSAEKWYNRLRDIEKTLHGKKLLDEHYSSNQYFTGHQYNGRIEDDHIPFLDRGVSILHVISAPFPQQWHRTTDDEAHLDRTTVANLNKILTVFVHEYLHLTGASRK